MIYIPNDVVFQCQQQYCIQYPELTSLMVKFTTQTHTLHFGFVYRNPNVARVVFSDFCETQGLQFTKTSSGATSWLMAIFVPAIKIVCVSRSIRFRRARCADYART